MSSNSDYRPLILTVPGLDNSGPDHWQSRWERDQEGVVRVDLGSWSRPHRTAWANKLGHAIAQAGQPVILAAHSLGCLAVMWWAALERPLFGGPVLGALLVAPPDVDRENVDPRVGGFSPAPREPLPFRSIVVASRDDPYMPFDKAKILSRSLRAQFADAGSIGHINAASGIGDWEFGRFLLNYLVSTSGQDSRIGDARCPVPVRRPDHPPFNQSGLSQ